MMKPKISDQDIQSITRDIVRETPSVTKFWISYGAALCAIATGFALGSGLPKSAGLIMCIAVAGAHWHSRKQFGETPALSKCDDYDLVPDAEIRQIETDEECKAIGIDIGPGDWPRLVKGSIQLKALSKIETLGTKALAISGYGFVVAMLLIT